MAILACPSYSNMSQMPSLSENWKHTVAVASFSLK